MYLFVNFVATLFSTANTVEFRIHPPTKNKDKIKLWVLLCDSIVKFALETPTTDKKAITLDRVIDSIIKDGSLKALMHDYVDSRKKYYDPSGKKLTRKMISENKAKESGIVISKFIKKHIGLNEISSDKNDLFMGEDYLDRYDLK